MLIAIVLLILAVVLFGSSAVIGAIGAVLGAVALFAALTLLVAYSGWMTGADPIKVAPLGILGLCIIAVAVKLLADHISRRAASRRSARKAEYQRETFGPE